MATDNKNRLVLPIASGDFESNKENLKAYLKSQPEFSDYNFDGSSMSLLLNLLSYDNYQKVFYLNQVGNEGFLSTAIRRDSVVARAKDIGYRPSSRRSSSIDFDLILTAPSITDPGFFVDSGLRLNGGDFVFSTIESYTANRQSDGTYLVSGLTAYEGKTLTFTQVIDNKTLKGFVIPNIGVDTTTLQVFVTKAGSATASKYTLADDIVSLTGTSKVFFLDEVDGMHYKVYFGDDIISASVGLGDTVLVKYIAATGETANGISAFTLSSSIPNVTGGTVVTTNRSVGGREIESIDSIRLSAPNKRRAQRRAVTPPDYEDLIEQLYSNAADVKAVNGASTSPPRYGKVVIYIKPVSGDFLNDKEKSDLTALLKPYSVVLSTPLILDPEYIYINITTNVTLDEYSYSGSEADFREALSIGIDEFGEGIERFNSVFRASNMVTFIDNFDPAVVSNDTKFFLEKRLVPVIDKNYSYSFSFASAIEECSMVSSEFVYAGNEKCFFADEDGILKVCQSTNDGIITLVANAGTVDVKTGVVVINSIEIDAVTESEEFYEESTGDYYIKFTVESKATLVGKEGFNLLKIGTKIINPEKTTENV